MLQTIRPLRLFAQAFTKESSPKQLALGLALGLMIGLVPKGNLIAAVLTFILFATRVNLAIGLCTALVISFGATWIDQLTHGIGARVLAQPTIQNQLAAWYRWPLVPWTSLNNTVVVGSLLLGATLFYPAYHFSESTFRWLQPLAAEKLKRYRLYQILFPTDLATSWRIG